MKSRVLFIAACVFVALLLSFVSVKCDSPSTVFYVVRHAEKASDPGSDRLSVPGMKRAQELSGVLRSVPLSAIYSSITRRTWQTVTPSALSAGVEITPYGRYVYDRFCKIVRVPHEGWDEWAADLKEKHAGEHVLIAGHSDTLSDIIMALGGQGSFPVNGYTDLYVVKIEDGKVEVHNQGYQTLKPVDAVTFKGKLHKSKDISAIAGTKDLRFLVIGSDETSEVQVLRAEKDYYEVQESIALGGDEEIDIEGITRHGDTNVFFVVGSHSSVRKNIMKEKHRKKTYQEIKKRFEIDSPRRDENRDRLIGFELNRETGELVPGTMKEAQLRHILDKQPVLGHFSKIPGKENGIDIEGIASDGEKLYLGFRGPVLRHGFAPVLVFPPNAPQEAELRYVPLDGLGIRDMAKAKGGFLLVAGPVGDAFSPGRIYFWDGRDCLPGKRSERDPPQGTVRLLETIPSYVEAGAEGILMLGGDGEQNPYEFVVVFDGKKGGDPTRFRATKP